MSPPTRMAETASSCEIHQSKLDTDKVQKLVLEYVKNGSMCALNNPEMGSCRQEPWRCHAVPNPVPGPTVTLPFLLLLLPFRERRGDGCANIVHAWMVHSSWSSRPRTLQSCSCAAAVPWTSVTSSSVPDRDHPKVDETHDPVRVIQFAAAPCWSCPPPGLGNDGVSGRASRCFLRDPARGQSARSPWSLDPHAHGDPGSTCVHYSRSACTPKTLLDSS